MFLNINSKDQSDSTESNVLDLHKANPGSNPGSIPGTTYGPPSPTKRNLQMQSHK